MSFNYAAAAGYPSASATSQGGNMGSFASPGYPSGSPGYPSAGPTGGPSGGRALGSFAGGPPGYPAGGSAYPQTTGGFGGAGGSASFSGGVPPSYNANRSGYSVPAPGGGPLGSLAPAGSVNYNGGYGDAAPPGGWGHSASFSGASSPVQMGFPDGPTPLSSDMSSSSNMDPMSPGSAQDRGLFKMHGPRFGIRPAMLGAHGFRPPRPYFRGPRLQIGPGIHMGGGGRRRW